ncbi:MAG: hypothetical protein ACRD24_09490 [Terriglobales bacterium]
MPELRSGEKVLIECNRCSGKLVLLNEGMGCVTVEAPTESLLLAEFSSWLREAAAETGLTPEAIAAEIGKPWSRTGPSAGCAHCLGVRAEPYVKGLTHVASGAISDELYQCPQCGAYRWKTFETHGFAEVEVWGKATREDLTQFQTYLEQESRRRDIAPENLIEEIFQKCV